MMRKNNKLIWIDLEMTGLNYSKDLILEIATIITDSNLEIIEEGPNLVIHHSNEILENMDPWCVEQHQKTKLTDAVKNSKISMQEAELETLKFLKKHCKPLSAPLCGNSIWFDKIFLNKDMPKLASFFFYRNVDVSSFKLMIQRWTNNNINFEKKATHRALDDIKESIEELKYYKKNYFNINPII